jgi:hypothetical protein
MKKTSDYNGWKNRQTWNCALWIGNDEPLYRSAVSFMNEYKGRAPYAAFIKSLGAEDDQTPDGIAWISSRISFRELNAMMTELRGDK